MGKNQWQTMVKTGIPVLALCAMVIALVGCSNKAPVSPFDNEIDGLRAIAYVEEHYTGAPLPGVILDPEAEQRYGGLKQEDAAISAETRQAFSATTVGEEGGEIILNFEPEASELVFLPGTVDELVYVRAKAALYHTPYGPVRMHEFSPEGLPLLQPATLYLSTNLPANTVLHLYWFNPKTVKWQVEQAGTADKDGVVTFRVSRLAKYAIA